MKIIGFNEGKFYGLSNFSAHKVVYLGLEYMTAEHAYQVAKFNDEKIARKIRNAPSAFLARQFGQEKNGRIDDLQNKKVGIMREIIKAKLDQHQDVKNMLLETGEATIKKNYDDDWFWGIGADGSGQNIMGKILMELRSELKK
jgi:N-glycosidase YbiA